MTLARALAVISLILTLSPNLAVAREVETVVGQTKAAAGGAALDAVKAIRLTYRLRQAGLEGTGTTLTDVMTGRTVTRFKLGPMTGAEGFDGRRAWVQDAAGIVTVPEGGDQRRRTVSAQYRNALAFWYPARSGSARVTLRLQLFRSRIKEALEVAPEGGLPFELWFDAQTKMLDRAIEPGASETRTIIYENYRPVGQIMVAHVIRSSNAAAAFGTERIVTKVELNPPLADLSTQTFRLSAMLPGPLDPPDTTARTVAAAPDLPAVLQPSEMAEPIYRRLGFERFTTFRTWTRRP